MDNRRRWPRIEVALRAVFRFGRDQDITSHSYVQDISLGGAFIITDQIRPKGTLIRLQLEFNDGSVFSAEGRVVRVVPPEIAAMKGLQPGLGIQFTQIADPDRQLLQDRFDAASD